ncbi:hypothetical protein INR49_024850 [Caranx melampygus]|nr:hypothetical protein INR49_024850 [Caranx melampygus]
MSNGARSHTLFCLEEENPNPDCFLSRRFIDSKGHSLCGYYNCVPFAGCVFVGPTKICQPRVKTFEELPLEMHPQKAPQDNQTDSGMVLASEEFERIEHKHRGAISKSRVSSSSSTEPLTASHGSLGRSSGTSSSRHHPSFFSQLSGQTFYNNEYGHLSEEGFCDFFSSPDASCLASPNV